MVFDHMQEGTVNNGRQSTKKKKHITNFFFFRSHF